MKKRSCFDLPTRSQAWSSAAAFDLQAAEERFLDIGPSLPEPLVLRLVLPLKYAPLLNVYARASVREHSAIKKFVDGAILTAIARSRRTLHSVRAGFTEAPELVKGRVRVRRIGGVKRAVAVTRFSSSDPDEHSVDVIGGKVPLDRLVVAGVLVDDDAAWCERALATWVKAPPALGAVVVEVFEVAK